MAPASSEASTPAAQRSSERRRVAILGGNRIPFARSDGAYAEASNQDMFTAALGGLVDRFGLAGERLGVVVGGAVLKHSRDFNLTRECVLGSQLASYTPAFDLQQACGTGLQAAIAAADGIAAGRYEVAAAGGVDTTSDAPIGLGDNLRRTLLKLRRAKSNVQRLKLVGTLPATLGVEIPVNSEPRTGLSMGEHQAITAKQMGISRVAQDELAAASHRNMAAAYDRGFFDDLVTPFLGLYRDDNLRADSSAEKLAKLRPVFGVKAGDATMTAGNSTPLTDGASVALLGTDEWAEAHSLTPLAYLVDSETAAVDYVNGRDGLLMAPTYAVPRLLARNGLSLQDFDFYEIHEAFASVVLCHLQAWESEEYCKGRLGLDAALGSIDRSKLNVNGSSLAAGHPFAATGGRILAQAAKQLAQRKAEQKGAGKPVRALVSICAAGGQGVAAILQA
ncbi:acetyl-CoA C-acetyltransferase [Mycobacterium intracellulare]|uniref:Acetyl-CoA C-acetyltransferase n=1 Tax=Mycobacterium intracellulare subsp. chimaera TaxID=222805 RepID=A0A220YJK5_MYCIT|nr:acetyl-CoA C-acetyltransferase [Mycobacterium intracellulare]AOS94008.1 acetyl-CoA acetyltransferase [Mycobacterium intracellulare subsp. chimaera]ARV84522.1 acetyl-CoA acetyltransferase [Mycobacterium intracellulare subsp. chimaera]ASL11868.1 acetyl-CoA acetyltransferase [Mycobacterium intracellulare subsp. chimaera]ASL17784.1 acetyl-CoA acetyltransferase [Mycobacterium intracellulare subsp. chimaera]ASL23818.1 acetyl-CoA acetyltransferase [Mycobacterium intracellulare subsp. chimaera]